MNIRFLLIVGMIAGTPPALAGDATLFAAASTTKAVDDIAAAYAEAGHGTLTAVLASSGQLARQIEAGAPADVFLSANPKWMDYLSERDLIVDDSRTDLLGNALVLIAPADMDGPEMHSPGAVAVDETLDLAGLLGDGQRLALADPEHAPAGQYARTSLISLGLWDDIEDRLARMADVRAVLAMVGRGETPLGILYATDAAASDGVKVLGTLPNASHPAITYPVAATRDATGDVQGAMAFLESDVARQIFRKHGFTTK